MHSPLITIIFLNCLLLSTPSQLVLKMLNIGAGIMIRGLVHHNILVPLLPGPTRQILKTRKTMAFLQKEKISICTIFSSKNSLISFLIQIKMLQNIWTLSLQGEKAFPPEIKVLGFQIWRLRKGENVFLESRLVLLFPKSLENHEIMVEIRWWSSLRSLKLYFVQNN